MKFEMLDKRMRLFEGSLDQVVLPDVYMVVRLDGRSFTRLTKEVLPLERPFDERFKKTMVETARHLMDCGFKIRYGYTQSDEISLLLDRSENTFARKTRKLISVLAGEASASFTQSMGAIGVFDCRIIPLPSDELVVDYFRWRAEDAGRNALNAWCYWTLRRNGANASQATLYLEGKSTSDKNQLLFENGINYNDLPAWQKRGVGLRYEWLEMDRAVRGSESKMSAVRRRLDVEMTLPINEGYTSWIRTLLTEENNE